MEYINYETLFKRISEINDNKYVFELLMLKKKKETSGSLNFSNKIKDKMTGSVNKLWCI